MMTVMPFLILGLAAGTLSGLIGIGGGLIIVPALVLIFGFTQLQAQGTTLALMVPPIGILAALVYFRQGYVDLKAAALICLGFFLGGIIGAKTAVGLPNLLLQRIFGAVLFIASLKMLFNR